MKAKRPAKPLAATVVLPIADVPPHGHLLEHDFQTPLMRAINAPKRNTRVFRTNVGSVTLRNRAGQETGRFNAGPVIGASDLQGFATVTIETIAGPLRIAPALAVEVKVDAPVSDAQRAYTDALNRAGAVALIIRYNHALSLADNVAAGIAAVDRAVAARVGGAAIQVAALPQLVV